MSSLQREELVRRLNEDLSLELRAVLQAIAHIGIHPTDSDATERTASLHKRIDGILALVSCISQLDDHPRINITPPHIGKTPRMRHAEDLALEKLILQRYRKRRAEADQFSEASELIDSRANEVRSNIDGLKKQL